MIVVIFLGILALIALYFLLHHYSVVLRRKRAKKKPTPESWPKLLRETFDWYENLSVRDEQKLYEHMKVFLAEKSFFSRAGEFLEENFRVLAAAEACLPLIHRKTNYYGLIHSVYVDKEQKSPLGGPLCLTSKEEPIKWLEILHKQFNNEMSGLSERVEKQGFLNSAEAFFRTPEAFKEQMPKAYKAMARFFGYQI